MTLEVDSGDMAGCCLVRTKTECLPLLQRFIRSVEAHRPVVTALGASIVRSLDSK